MSRLFNSTIYPQVLMTILPSYDVISETSPYAKMNRKLSIFSTCPAIDGKASVQETRRQIRDVARWSEESGCDGMLIYTENRLADPWLSALFVAESTERLSPLIAVQPIYMHPYAAAKMVSTIGLLTGRRVYLNMLAGGFINDLKALNDVTPHDERYDRTVEYTSIIQSLLQGEAAVSFNGKYYNTENLKLTPGVPPELMPGILLSGSSSAGLAASRKLGATAIQYPEPPSEYKANVAEDGIDYGIRIGLIARNDPADAWKIAEARFPEDRRGQITHTLSMKWSDSEWHQQLSRLGEYNVSGRNPYWLRPFENYKTFCPYLVGSYEDVAAVVKEYIDLGYSTFIMDIPGSPEDFEHQARVFELATR